MTNKIINYRSLLIDSVLIQENDILKITAGEKIPADGIIIKGCTEIDESLLTGESIPVVKNIRDKIFAGSINCHSTIYMIVTNCGNDIAIEQLASFIHNSNFKKVFIIIIIKILGSYWRTCKYYFFLFCSFYSFYFIFSFFYLVFFN